MREIALGHVVMDPMTRDAKLASTAMAAPLDMEMFSVDIAQPEDASLESPQD
jgi:hypothetical protein